MREEPQRIAGRLEGTLRVPDVSPRAIVVVAHPLPTHGGTMRFPLVAAIARACADQAFLALRFNFRGVGGSAGAWTNGESEPQDIADAAAHARTLAPGLPLAVSGFSFGARMILGWIGRGGTPDAVALVGLPLRSAALDDDPLPPAPKGVFVVAAGDDQYGTAAEVRDALPTARIHEFPRADHFFTGRHREVAHVVAWQLAEDLSLARLD